MIKYYILRDPSAPMKVRLFRSSRDKTEELDIDGGWYKVWDGDMKNDMKDVSPIIMDAIEEIPRTDADKYCRGMADYLLKLKTMRELVG